MRLICLRCRCPEATADLPASERLFPPGFDEQREAAEIALSQAVTVLTGGPGTGKTTTVARSAGAPGRAGGADWRAATPDRVGSTDRKGGCPAAARRWPPRSPSSTRPTRARLAGLQATTLHRLLGSRPDTSVAVPAQSRQPLAARRDRRRRDVDGVADNDGAAAGSGAARTAG